MKTPSLLASLVFVCAIASANPVAGQILQNGSFEAGFAGWTASGNQTVVNGDPSHPASDGSSTVVLAPGNLFSTAVLSQTFATTPGQRYGVAFDVGSVGAVHEFRIRVTVAGSSQLVNRVLEFTGVDDDPFYIPQRFSFVANSTSTTLSFTDLTISPLLVDALLDNVRVTTEDPEAPLIVSDPQRLAVMQGRDATFSVTASGVGPFTYQWQFGGVNIPGATGSVHTVSAADASDTGSYSVVVTNAAGSVTSSAATLLVLPPAILLNGSFEYGSAAWTLNDILRVYTTLNPIYEYTDGRQLMHFSYGQNPNGGVMSQSFPTIPGEEYVLAFDFGASSSVNQDQQRVRVRVLGQTGTLLDQNLSTFAPGNGTTYVPAAFNFVADGTTATLSFEDTSTTTLNVDVVIDNVRLTLPSAAPVITVPPQSQTVNAGENATFTVIATGEGTLTYQWRREGTAIPGATGSSYSIPNVQASDAGNYDVIVSNFAGSTTSAVAALTVQGVPAITAQPESATVAAGTSVSFSVTASGAAPLSYQWRRNGAPIAGANASTLLISNAQPSHAGTYDVLVSNSIGAVTSAVATLTVISAGALANGSFEDGYIGWTAAGNQQVVSASPYVASDGLKAVSFNGGQKPPNGVLSQSFVTSVGQAYILAIDVGAISFVNQGLQRLQVTVQGTSTLLSQTISVTAPGNGTQYVPHALMFVADSTVATLTFRDVSTVTTNVDLMLDNVRVTAQNAPIITSHPQSATVAPGSNVSFSVTAAGQGSLSYQWRRNSSPIPGANSSTYVITNAQPADSGSYDVVVSNSFGSTTSAAATLAVTFNSNVLANGSFESDFTGWTATGNQRIVANTPSHPPSDGSKAVVFNENNASTTAVLSQVFTTTPGQRYALSFDIGTVGAIADQRIRVIVEGNGILLDHTSVVSGPSAGPFYVPQHLSFVANSTSTRLTMEDDSYTYFVIDSILDNVRVVPVHSQAPLVTAQPQSTHAAAGGSATFSVSASGSNLTYQWHFNGSPIAGATSSSYTVTDAQTSDAGNYSVVVTNPNGSVSSSAAVLTVLPPAILLNGSFEFGSAAWTFSGSYGGVSTSTNTNYGVTDGTQLVHFNWGQQPPTGILSQSFATTPGQTYVLTFDVGAVSGVNQDAQRMRVSLEGANPLLSHDVTVFAPGNGWLYVPQTFTFIADSVSTKLRFQDISQSTLNVDLLLDNVRITVQSGPTITSQPQSASVAAGSGVSFSVTATGQAPLSYQWRFNDAPISGATSSSYTIASAQPSHAGSYEVVVSNGAGSVTSATATLLVLTAGDVANGSFEADTAGWTATGNLVVVSASPYVASDGVKAMSFNGGQKTPNAVLSQSFATTIGQSYTLSIDVGAISLSNQHEQRLQVTVQGNSALVSQTVSVFAPGNGTTYVSRNFAFVADSTTTTLTFRDVSTTTTNVDLMLDNVRITTQSGPVITSQPESATVTTGSGASFSVTATGQGSLSYQWRFNGAPISGATSSSYTIASAQPSHTGSYDVVVSNIGGSITSETATLVVLTAGNVTNGSFEADKAGWTTTGNLVVVSASPYVATHGIKAMSFNGGQKTPNGVLSQSFATTIGQSYTLSIDVGAISLVNQQEQRLQITVQGNNPLVSQTVSVFAPGNGTTYLSQTFTFVADSTVTMLTFRDVSTTTSNVDLMLDNVRITAP